jgi:hypothetical protein
MWQETTKTKKKKTKTKKKQLNEYNNITSVYT